ncbi:MAG: LamB/YcsF family protein [Cellulomonadaceae bacterium]|nr:LamB/YcsF family protein [Cellulomonadaceae bacterium]
MTASGPLDLGSGTTPAHARALPPTGPAIDLNADVGESHGSWNMGDDASLLTLVSSASVACGFHAGDPTTARATCAAAAAAGVVVGAHVGYRDLVGFGRRFMDVAPRELADEVVYQVGALSALAGTAGTAVRYVKPHGALYNAIVHHEAQARAVVDAICDVDRTLALYVLPGSVIDEIATAAGLRTLPEAFADRAYTPQGTLVPRTVAGSVLHDAREVAARVVQMAVHGTVEAIDGSVVTVSPATVCLHGDTPGAVTIATAVRAALDDADVRVASAL